MSQIYVVCSQHNALTGTRGVPVAAYSDYPSALTYAQSIFVGAFGSEETAKDLIFLLNLTPAAGSVASAVNTAVTAATNAVSAVT